MVFPSMGVPSSFNSCPENVTVSPSRIDFGNLSNVIVVFFTLPDTITS